MVETKKSPKVMAITGGKGGVGKTSIAINLAIALARQGAKVCLLDGDTALANTNIMLGLYPAYTLEHLFTGEKSIQDIVLEGPEGLHIIPGASGFAQCVDLDVGQQQRLVTSIKAIEPHYDYMLVDTAAGISTTVLHFIAASQIAMVVVTPEPTSLTDAFSLLKVLKRRGYKRRVQVLVNMAANSAQAKKVYQRFAQAAKKYLQLEAEYFGSVWMDESMRSAVNLQRPVALFPKTDPSSKAFFRLAENVEDLFDRPGIPKLAFSAYWQKVVERQSQPSQSAPRLHKPSAFDELRRRVEKLSKPMAEPKAGDEARTKSLKEDAGIITVGESGSHSPYQVPVDSTVSAGMQADEVLSAESEDAWVDLRVRLNNFFSDTNTTPEQMTTLLSGCILSFGDRIGNAAVDLLHGLLHSLDPEQLTDEQKQLLLSDYERLGLDSFRHAQKLKASKAKYDSKGFGDQQELARAIRSSAEDMPLETLLESIKYASLVDGSDSKS